MNIKIENFKDFYKQDKLTIYNMDCMDLMKQYPDKYFDLAIVDPPYGIGQDGSKNKSRGNLAIAKDYKPYTGNDLNPPNQEYFNELIRVSKDQIIWGENYFNFEQKKNYVGRIIWDKFTADNSTRKFNFMWAGFNQGKSIFEGHIMQGNKKLNETRIHPNQKPIALYTWLLNKYAQLNFKILDTHLGSGSHAIACNYFGAELIASELDNHYFLESIKRIKKETAQLSIF